MEMNSQRIIGIVMVVVGVALLIVGINASHSVLDQASNTLAGRFTQVTTWYIIGGIAAGLFGLLLTMFGPGSRTS